MESQNQKFKQCSLVCTDWYTAPLANWRKTDWQTVIENSYVGISDGSNPLLIRLSNYLTLLPHRTRNITQLKKYSYRIKNMDISLGYKEGLIFSKTLAHQQPT